MIPLIANTIIFAVVAFVAYIVGYKKGYEHGSVKYGWCGYCRSWHGNDVKCQELPENA